MHPKCTEPDSAHQQERAHIRDALTPLFTKARCILKWMLNHHEVYNEFGRVCQQHKWPWKRFDRETATRWSSQLDMLVSMLHNAKSMESARPLVLEKFPDSSKSKIPEGLSDDDCMLAQHICAVLTPFKVATRQMEGNKESSLASCILPTWFGLKRAISGRVPKPLGAGEWGSELVEQKYLERESLHEVARRLSDWLCNDMDLQLKKHVGDDSACRKLLRGASFLDPRHKRLGFLPDPERKAAHQWVIDKAFGMAGKDEEFKDHVVQAAKERKADELAKAAAAMHPAVASENVTLSALPAVPARIGKHMRVGELKEACKIRKLAETGKKKELVQRLDLYKHEDLTKKAEKEYVSAQVAACFLFFIFCFKRFSSFLIVFIFFSRFHHV